jgi:hypothetical protein
LTFDSISQPAFEHRQTCITGRNFFLIGRVFCGINLVSWFRLGMHGPQAQHFILVASRSLSAAGFQARVKESGVAASCQMIIPDYPKFFFPFILKSRKSFPFLRFHNKRVPYCSGMKSAL